MTDAGHVQEHLSAYLDAELDAADTAAIEVHLSTCESCSAELAALRAVHSELLQSEPVTQPDDYWRAFAARVDARLPDVTPDTAPWGARLVNWFVPSGRFGWMRAASAVATVTLLVYVGMYGMRDGALRPQPEQDVGVLPDPAASQRDRSSSTPVPARTPQSREPVADVRLTDEQLLEAAVPEAEGLTGSMDADVREKKKERNDDRLILQAPAGNVAKEPPEDRKRLAAPQLQSVGEVATRLNEPVAPAEPAKDAPASSTDSGRGAAASVRPESEEALAERDLVRDSQQLSRVSRLSSPASGAVSSQVRLFASAALADDLDRAEEVRRELERTTPTAQDVLAHMRDWSRAAAPRETLAPMSKSLSQAVTPAPGALRALDALIWPRRDAAGFGPVVEQLALELDAASVAVPELETRAHAYYEFLLEKSVTDADRARWRGRLDALGR